MKTLINVPIILAIIWVSLLIVSRHEVLLFSQEVEEARNRLRTHKAILLDDREIETLNLHIKKMHALAEDPYFTWITSSKWLEIKPIDYTAP